MAEGYYHLSDCYVETGPFDLAERYADSCVYMGKEMKWDFYTMVGYERQYYARKAAGDYKGALEAFEKFSFIDDSLINVKRMTAINDLETKYQTEKKEQENLNLKQEAEIISLRAKIE